MTEKRTQRRVQRRAHSKIRVQTTAHSSEDEAKFLKVGKGTFGYIRALSSAEAQHMFPTIPGLTESSIYFTLFGADGMAIAITDDHGNALRHANDEELHVLQLN